VQYTGVWYEFENSCCSLVFEFSILRHCSPDAGLDRSEAPNIVQNIAPKSLQSHIQDKDFNSDIIPAFESLEARVDIVNFPYHRSGRHVEPVRHSLLTSCPAVVGSLALQPQKDSLSPCQACTFCLP